MDIVTGLSLVLCGMVVGQVSMIGAYFLGFRLAERRWNGSTEAGASSTTRTSSSCPHPWEASVLGMNKTITYCDNCKTITAFHRGVQRPLSDPSSAPPTSGGTASKP